VAELKVQVVPAGYTAGDLGGPPVFERLSDRIDEVGICIREIADRLRHTLETDVEAAEPDGSWHLDTLDLQFSVQLEAETGVIVAKATTTAGFEVTLGWKRETNSPARQS
jgi:hypothetical protein